MAARLIPAWSSDSLMCFGRRHNCASVLKLSVPEVVSSVHLMGKVITTILKCPYPQFGHWSPCLTFVSFHCCRIGLRRLTFKMSLTDWCPPWPDLQPEPAGIRQSTLIPSWSRKWSCFSVTTAWWHGGEQNRQLVSSTVHDLIAHLSLYSCRRHSHSCPACQQDAIKAPPRLLWQRSLFFPLRSCTRRSSVKSSSFWPSLFRTRESGVLLSAPRR